MANEKLFPELTLGSYVVLGVDLDGIIKAYINGEEWAVASIALKDDEVLVTETEFGQEPSPGTSDAAARADHTHGSPEEPEEIEQGPDNALVVIHMSSVDEERIEGAGAHYWMSLGMGGQAPLNSETGDLLLIEV